MPFEGPHKDISSNEKPALSGFARRRAEAGLDPRTGEPLRQEVSPSVKPGWSAIPAQYEARDPYAAVRSYLQDLPEGSDERHDAERYLSTLDAGEIFEGVLEEVRIRVEDRLRQRKLLL